MHNVHPVAFSFKMHAVVELQKSSVKSKNNEKLS